MTELELVQSAQIPMPKTAEDHQRELATLEIELRHVTALKDSLDEFSRDVQRKLTLNLSGGCTVDAVNQAQKRLDEAIAAHARIPALTRAIANAREAAQWAAGRERKAFCDSVAHDFDVVFERYKNNSRQVFEDYKELTQISQKYLALTNRSLMEAWHRELNLPVLTGMLSARSGFTTGTME